MLLKIQSAYLRMRTESRVQAFSSCRLQKVAKPFQQQDRVEAFPDPHGEVVQPRQHQYL